MLYSLFEEIWEKEEIPAEWKEDYLIKIPKKGDLNRCDNYRGITLLRRGGQKGDETAKPFESCKNHWRRVLQEPLSSVCKLNSTVLAELDGFCRTRRFSQTESTVFAELDVSRRQNSTGFLQNSTVLAGLDRFCRFVTLLAATAPHSWLRSIILDAFGQLSMSGQTGESTNFPLLILLKSQSDLCHCTICTLRRRKSLAPQTFVTISDV
ncbi:hypothetical protein LSAT2_011227 [Lamellibrachia satsuma]|nr:hypothetical protein LSAT2_011227 [Lamellibrachia satsuma]